MRTYPYYTLRRPTNSTQGGREKDWGTEDWGLATRAREPGTDKQTDRQTDGRTE